MLSEFSKARDLVIKKRVVLSNPPRLDLGEYKPFLNHLEADTHAITYLFPYGDVGLVQKNRPYVNGPADMMMVPFYRPVSLITECSPGERHGLFSLSGHLVSIFQQLQPQGYPVIAINQQPGCVDIPNKHDKSGTVLKVQTINQLHFHIFIEDGSGQPMLRIAQLKPEDKNDFFDPFSVVAAEMLKPIIDQYVGDSGLGYDSAIFWNSFPLGVRIFHNLPLHAAVQDPQLSTFISEIQTQYCAVYKTIASCFLDFDSSGALKSQAEREREIKKILNNNKHLSVYSQRLLSLLATNVIPQEDENRKYLRFVQGPALTWTLFEQDNRTVVNLSPRILSRGNAMEALGIWKDQFEDAPLAIQRQYNLFYSSLLEHIDPQYMPTTGPLLNLQT